MDEALIVSYLLGDLEDAERTQFEQRFLRDAEYRELMQAVEDDLIDDYVRGELSAHQRELFEKQFTTSPHRARKVELARALNQALGDSRRVSASATVPLTFPGRRHRLIGTFRYPLAAAALLLLGLGVWFVAQTSGTRPDVQPPQAEQRPPVNTPSTKPQDRSGQPASQLAIATFVLPPGLVRDSTAARTFVIPEGTQVVQLRLQLEKGDEYQVYRAELRTASGSSVWKSDTARLETDAAGQAVVLDVPADLVRPDRYELTLTGVNKGVVEDLGYYYFSFVKQ